MHLLRYESVKLLNLSRSKLSLPDIIAAPSYDVTQVKPGIVHIGLGGFHRAHFARYTHDLMQIDPSAFGWGIIGAGLRPHDSALLAALNSQDGLYTLVERDSAGESRMLIGSLVRTIDASQDNAPLIAAIVAPQTKIVSITVSEHGYHLDSVTRTLNQNDPAIRHDIASPRSPKTLPGILVETFRQRREQGVEAFTALSCDNIQHNGKVLQDVILALAQQSDPGLAAWIADNACFPCSMVDRITPMPTADEIAAFHQETELADSAPIFAESFRQWVIEDRFVDGRPEWDRVGAQFVDDVTPYETMKLRLLNASHLAIAGLGALMGYETVIQTIGDPMIRRYMVRLMDNETGPTLLPVPGIDLTKYKQALIERFANPAIRDTLRRINADAPVNLLLDPLRDRLAADASIDLLTLAIAAWCQRVKIESTLPEEGRAMGKSEALLQERARGQEEPLSFLSVDQIFGPLGREERVVTAVRFWLQSFNEKGVNGTLAEADI